MGVIATIVCFLLLFVCLKSTHGGLTNPFVLYFALWSLILSFSMMHLYGMYVPSDKTYVLITLMNCFFFFGGTVRLPRKKVYTTQCCAIALNEKIIFILAFIGIVFKFINFVEAFQNILNGAQWWQVRQAAYAVYGSEEAGNSLFREILENVIVIPFTNIAIPISAYLFFREPKRLMTKMMVTYFVLSTVLDSISGGGGRLGYIYIAGCYIYSFLMLDRQVVKQIYVKYRRKIILISIILGGVLIMITVYRVGIDNLFRQVYTYFGMTPALLDVNLKLNEHPQYTFGLLTLFGFHTYIFRFLNVVGLDFLIPRIYEISYEYLLNGNTFKQVGFGTANAFVSPVYYFYLDGGVLFVVIASFAFGVILSNCFRKVRINMNEMNFCYYTLMMNGVFLTFIRIQTAVPAFVISFFMVKFLMTKKISKIGIAIEENETKKRS